VPDGAREPEPWARSRIAALVLRLALLLFVAYPIVGLFATRADPLEVVLALAADAIFLGLALVGARWDWNDPRRASPLLAVANLALTGCATALFVHQGGTAWFALFYYASSSAAVIAPAVRATRLMLVAGAAGTLAGTLSFDDPAAAAVQGISIAVIGLIVQSSFQIRRANAQLFTARNRLAELAVAEERDRIARDLHDTLGHSLSLIAVKSELAARLLPDQPQRARAEVADIERTARDALAAVRETVSGYHRPSLTDELAGARSAFSAAGIAAEVEPPPASLPPLVDTLLAWTVREAVTNVLRHSGAQRASVRFARSDQEATVEVTDDGSGPLPASADASGNGSGIAGLRDRVATAGGSLQAGAAPGHGFRLCVTVPLTPGGGGEA
jgi:two-component system sensor histidine kinase DesK